MKPTNNSKDYCPNCKQITNHQCLYSSCQSSSYDDFFDWIKYFETIQCLGCENIQFRDRYSSEDMVRYDDDGEVERYEESKYYPKTLAYHELLENKHQLPNQIRVVYIESIEALKNNCYILAGAGLRAVIEAICLAQNIKGKDLAVKINNLVKNKLITEKDGNRLHSIRFLGNDSVHQMQIPKEEKLRVALDIVEHLLKNLYLIDIQANRHLDVYITQYDDFKVLLIRKLRDSSIDEGAEKSIKELLGKEYRRIESSYLPNFINKIISEINDGTITNMALGKVENDIQLFIKCK